MAIFTSLDELRAAVGTELGASNWVLITQQRIDAFADCTEDRQWIHTDSAHTANGPFAGPIAHGYLTLSLISRFLEDLVRVENVNAAINYGLDRVRFPSPVPVDSRLRGRARIATVDDVIGGVQVVFDIAVECDSSEKPVCVARSLTRYMGRE